MAYGLILTLQLLVGHSSGTTHRYPCKPSSDTWPVHIHMEHWRSQI